MTATRVSADWLALRERFDAAARATELVDELRRHLPADRPLSIHDLACGTGSMLRWLAPQLPGPQHWVCYDQDADLLARAAGEQHHRGVDGSSVGVTIRERDVTRLDATECAGAGLITAAALLDLLTYEELARFVGMCVGARCPVLFTLSVTGRVELWPPDPWDAAVGAAFNAHQRRAVGARTLLGSDAPDAVARALRRSGYQVETRPSLWRVGPTGWELTVEWLTGWLAAAYEQQPELATQSRRYADRRLADAAAGRLRVVVHHRDVLAWPGPKAR